MLSFMRSNEQAAESTQGTYNYTNLRLAPSSCQCFRVIESALTEISNSTIKPMHAGLDTI
jgi:hypothetical protein